MIRRVLAAGCLALALGACQGEADQVAARSTSTSPTTTAAAADTTTTTTTAAAETTTTLEPLDLAISIHVEGWDDFDPAVYEQHLAIVEQLAAEAEAAGITLTFELSRPFTEGTLAAGDGWVASLPGRGQAVGVHADLGGTPMPPQVFARRLAEHKALVEEALGASVTHVSGVCSEAPWVEAVIDAGFTAATGMVEWCLTSLDEVPAGYDLTGCRSPATCHDQAPTDMEHKLHPWRTSTSADWLTPDPDGDLWLVAGESGSPFPTDAADFATIVESYLAARDEGRSNSLVLAWSVGASPPAGFVTELAASIAHLGDDVRWMSVADLAR